MGLEVGLVDVEVRGSSEVLGGLGWIVNESCERLLARNHED